ncbi:2-dehydropantoate 2-reductase [Vibrio hippocampi]|uniref:2-dehydropantoate 2-reductase n=1 Tax=Vibrio hippocampi TaxID=654686 RepID=A0ABM8ZJH9_9VIBR|nr:2-dehydropantoate 2-reductase [Vibrio hippocampi]CAH0526730.1 2-dehydropantoate 2-reductase [Vibrio hippocampi]
MNITILGPGAIGSLWAHKLANAGHNVSLWGRDSSETLRLQLDDTSPQTFANRDPNSLVDCDLLLVTLKAWQVLPALESLKSQINQDTILVLMHNGMGTAQPVCDHFASNPVVIATTTHGAFKPNKYQVQHTGQGMTQLGGMNKAGQQCHFLQAVLDHALPEVRWNDNIQAVLWNKLAVNCAINPLTAIEQCQNGELARPPFQAIIEPIVLEIVKVMQAEGIATDFQTLLATVNQVISHTATNFSSMRQDVYHQRKTEIDFINGYLISVAKQHHLATPENSKLYQAIKQIEQGWITS